MVFKVYDHDWGSLDDFMGRATVELTTINDTELVESFVVRLFTETSFCREEEMKLELKDDASSEELGFLLVKLRVESGTTHVAEEKDQKSEKTRHVCFIIEAT